MLALILASLLPSPSAEARSLQWTYNCEWTVTAPITPGVSRVQVVKRAYKNRGGKWESKFSVVVHPKSSDSRPRIYTLENSGDGDEDYMNYKLAVRDDRAPVQGATIQNQLKWIKVLDEDGSGSWDCR